MRKIFLAAAILPLLGGVALAGPGGGGGSPNVGRNVDTASGPAAYPNAAQLWAAQRATPNTSVLMGWLQPSSPQQPG